MKKNKKAVSPVVSTVLLIMVVVILAIIIIVWSSGFIKEIVLKEVAGESKRAEKFCSEIELDTEIYSNSFGVTNKGNVPIYALSLKLTTGSESRVDRVEGQLNPGFSIEIDGYDYYDYDEVLIMPIVLGTTKKGGTQEFPCPEVYGIPL